jgi:hypothetical protein
MARLQSLRSATPLPEALDGLKRCPSVRKRRSAKISGRDTIAMSHEQPRTKHRLQLLDALADAGLGDPDFFRGSREAAVFDDRGQHPKMSYRDISYGHISPLSKLFYLYYAHVL